MEKKQWLRDIAEAAIVFVLIFFMTITNMFSSLDYLLKDAVYQTPRGIDHKIKIIGIDERTLEQLGPVNTWSRQRYADLIAQLNIEPQMSPAVIGIDVQFSGYVDADGDTAFAKRCEESGNVVVASQFVYKEKSEIGPDGIRYYPVDDYLMPYKELADATVQGFTCLFPQVLCPLLTVSRLKEWFQCAVQVFRENL